MRMILRALSRHYWRKMRRAEELAYYDIKRDASRRKAIKYKDRAERLEGWGR